MTRYDVIILGAGAAGLFCAIEAGRRGRRVLVIDHARAPGEKIRISGGGRCNFTNLHASPANFLSANPRFCVSALKRFTAADFIARVDARGIAWHEKTLGQLFCDTSSKAIINMLVDDAKDAAVEIALSTEIMSVSKTGEDYSVKTGAGDYVAGSLVVATGGKSIPKMGATGLAYSIAAQFGLAVIEPRPALVPLVFADTLVAHTKTLSGVSVDAQVSCGKTAFREGLLFTHRGVSGPSILQISSYWREGDEIAINLAPGANVVDALTAARTASPRLAPVTALAHVLPRRLADFVIADADAAASSDTARIADLSDKRIAKIADAVSRWRIRPVGSEGFRTAEVTLGGVDTNELSSKTMEARRAPGLYFIGEAVDVTGWLGGYNFQWAWSSGWAAGQAA